MSNLNNITNIPDINNIGVSVEKSEEEINIVIARHIRELSASSCENIETPPLDLFDFLRLIKLCVEARQDTEGCRRQNRINFLENDPPNVLDNETIAFEFIMRVPGQMDQAPLGKGRTREVTPHLRYVTDHPSIPNNKLITYGKYYEDLISFNVYARESHVALKRALWFEKVMDSFRWCFRLHGFTPVEEGIGHKEIINIGEIEVVKYPISYRVRSDDTFHVTEQELRNIIFKFNVSK